MTNSLRGETWKKVQIPQQAAGHRLEVSNLGRIRTFNSLAQGKILKGSIINGYPIIRLKIFKERDEAVERELVYLREQIATLQKNLRETGKSKDPESVKLVDTLKKSLAVRTEADLKQRTIYYHSLIHRLVAEYFIPKPGKAHTVVAHLDYDKLNNHFRNLAWMTIEENRAHQQKSPYVIAHKDNREVGKGSKLSVTRVMYLKKLLHENKPIKSLVKQFKVTETQILRIKRGENWGSIEAAP
ncbi:MAG TPA: HNH endonuclease [Ferruginibacter sp.]|nr:HNH endonuclease [Ferruginibacter sp.]